MVTQRAMNLRARALDWRNWQNCYLGHRTYNALHSLSQTVGQHAATRQARMLADICLHHPALVWPEELIVGYIFNGDDGVMWSETYLAGNVAPPQRAQFLKMLAAGDLSPEQLAQIDGWLTDYARIGLPVSAAQPMAERARAARDESVFWGNGRVDNHNILAYDRVIREGFLGIAETLRERRAGLDLADPRAPGSADLIDNALIVCEAAATLGQTYAAAARATLPPGPELDALCEMLAQVPARGARTLREAVQALWFAHMVNCWEDGINANCFGRVDQYLYPYYAADVQAGRITPEQAKELIACLWIKIYRDYEPQQAMVGGQLRAGGDATNALTHLILDATDELDLLKNLSVRVHRGTPPELFEKCMRMVRKGRGLPYFFNDDTVIPALVANGVSPEDAREYSAIGCVELSIPGKSHTHPVGGMVNLLKCLELALNGGRSLLTGAQLGPDTGDASAFTTMEQLLAAYRAQVDYFIKLMAFETNRTERECDVTCPLAYKSMLTEGCIESGRGYAQGGATYDHHQVMIWGLPNVADSLMAAQKFVFETGTYTMAQLVEAVREDFPDERMRRMLVRGAPKYGNDIPEVDDYAAMALNEVCDALAALRDAHGGRFTAQPFTFLWLMGGGRDTGASLDGRKARENLAYSVSAMQGRDAAGLTALLNSIARLPHDRCAGSTSAIVEVDPALFSEANMPGMVSLVRTALNRGVGQLQFNVVNADTLRDAQIHPENHRNLVVRVTGYSQAFVFLEKQLQDHIIARTKHSGA